MSGSCSGEGKKLVTEVARSSMELDSKDSHPPNLAPIVKLEIEGREICIPPTPGGHGRGQVVAEFKAEPEAAGTRRTRAVEPTDGEIEEVIESLMQKIDAYEEQSLRNGEDYVIEMLKLNESSCNENNDSVQVKENDGEGSTSQQVATIVEGDLGEEPVKTEVELLSASSGTAPATSGQSTQNNKTRGGPSSMKNEPPPKRARSEGWYDSSTDTDSSDEEEDDIFQLPSGYKAPSDNPEVIALQQSYQEDKDALVRKLHLIHERGVIQARLAELQQHPGRGDQNALVQRLQVIRDHLLGVPSPLPSPSVRTRLAYQWLAPSTGRENEEKQDSNFDKTLSDSEMMPPPPPPKAVLITKEEQDDEDATQNFDNCNSTEVEGGRTTQSGPRFTANTEDIMGKPIYVFEGREYVALDDHPSLRPLFPIPRATSATGTAPQPLMDISFNRSRPSSDGLVRFTTDDFPAPSNTAHNNIRPRLPTLDPRPRPSSRIPRPPDSDEDLVFENQPPVEQPTSAPEARQQQVPFVNINSLFTARRVLQPPPEVDIYMHSPRNSADDSDYDYYDLDELGVASDSDLPENPIEHHDSSSSSPSSTGAIENFPVGGRGDIEAEGVGRNEMPTTDSDNNGSSEIEEKPPASVKWNSKPRECASCDSLTPYPFLFCRRCFRIRRNWLPQRPANRRLKQRKRLMNRRMDADSMIMCNRLENQNAPTQPQPPGPTTPQARLSPVIFLYRIDAEGNEQTGSLESVSVQQVDLNNAFLASSEDKPDLSLTTSMSMLPENGLSELLNLTPPSSTEEVDKDKSEIMPTCPSLDLNSKIDDCDDQNESSELSRDQVENMDEDSPSDETCIICCARKKNAAFVHGKLAHFCCCFTCGDKILKRDGKCPICRERVLRLVKVLDS